MQFIDLQKQYNELKNEIDKGIEQVLRKSDFIMGEAVGELELQLANYVGVKHCITCANGTDALTLALMAYDVKKGDAVFVPTFTFYASAEVVALSGATPIFVDVDLDTYNISVDSLEKAVIRIIKEGELIPRAIIAVDLFGLPADYEQIKKVAEEYNLLLIEDGAQGFGGGIGGRKACSFGDIATTSFFPAKPLGCYGDGGAVFTNEDSVSDYLASIKVHGKGSDKYDNVRVGLNSRLDTLQAAVLMPKLRAFQEYELDARKRIAKKYDGLLKDAVKIPTMPQAYASSYAQYSILIENETKRDLLQNILTQNDIPSMVYYKKSMHQQTVFRNNPSSNWGFPNAEELSKCILSLPMHPYLIDIEIESICNIVRESC